MSDFLPEEIIINILKRLPIRPLICCMCVSRSWYILISSPEFISTHLNFTTDRNKNPPLLLLRRCFEKINRYELYCDNGSFDLHFKLRSPFRSANPFFTIVGSCNGLLCLSDDRIFYTNTIIIWNPCVKKSVLPKPNIIYNSYGSFVQSLGFGFDSLANDYQVLRITYTEDFVGRLPQIELYSLSTGVWQDISHLGRKRIIIHNNRSRQAYVNGAAHWIARFSDGVDLILLFDMCGEEFREIRLPASLAIDESPNSKELVVYKESLALVSSGAFGVGHDFCSWVMNEYGVVESWTKQFNVNFQDFGVGFMNLLSFRRDGEVLIVTKDGFLVSYDSNLAKVSYLDFPGCCCDEYRRSVHVDVYARSLVLLDKGPDFCDAVTLSKLPSLYLPSYGCATSGKCGSNYSHNHEVNESIAQENSGFRA